MSSPIRPAHQNRSHETSERILSATERLLRRRSFAGLSVAEIAAAAGVAVGTVYARFENKEALLALLYERYLEDSRDRLATCLTAMQGQLRVEDRVASAIDHIVDKYIAYTGVLRSIILQWRAEPDRIDGSPWQRDVLAFYERMAAAVVAGDASLDDGRARFGLHLVVNLCRDFYLFPELLADRGVPGWRETSRTELRRMLLAYLRAD